jgi:hypothetical protein
MGVGEGENELGPDFIPPLQNLQASTEVKGRSQKRKMIRRRGRGSKRTPHTRSHKRCIHGLKYKRACNSAFRPFEEGNTNWQMNSEKHQKILDNGEDLDDFQRHHVDRPVEQKIEERPGFEWILLGAC